MQLSFSLYKEIYLACPDRPLRGKAFPNEGILSESQFFLGAVAFRGIIGIAGKIDASWDRFEKSGLKSKPHSSTRYASLIAYAMTRSW